jgi:adenine-specific DNA-methyltransferase
MPESPEKLDLRSLDVAADKRRLLHQLFPEVFTESTGADGNPAELDFEKLKAVLGEHVDLATPGQERYGLEWPGKRDALKAVQAPSLATLIPAPEESVDWETTQNVFIEGDNLEVLKLLQKSYYGKVKMIYIDPPYNTGNDFVYPDNYAESLDTYLRYTGKIDDQGFKTTTNSKDSGRFHSNWLRMMYPRLYVAKNLLREDGVIFISIDDNEVSNLRHLCDQIFGEENFVDTIAIEMSTTSGPKTVNAQQGTIVKNVEFVHIYRKSPEFDKTPHTPLRDGISRYDTHYSIWLNEDHTLGSLADKMLQDERVGADIRRFNFLSRGEFSVKNMDKLFTVSDAAKAFVHSNLEKIARIDRPPVSAEGNKTSVGEWKPFKVVHRTYFLTTLDNGTLQALMPLSLNFKVSDDYKPKFGRTVIRGDLWKGFHQDMGNVAKEGGIAFDNGKKPIRLVKQLIKWAGNSKQDMILDFFSGSGTTAHAVMSVNADDGGERRSISVQLPESCEAEPRAMEAGFKTIADITKERIRRAGAKIREEHEAKLKAETNEADLLIPQSSKDNPSASPDIGFRVFKLAPSNFKRWDGEAAAASKEALVRQMEATLDHIAAEATEDSLLFEILLKAGYQLTCPMEKLTLAGHTVWSVDGGSLFVCVEDRINSALVDAVAAKHPVQFICLDRALQGNDPLKVNTLETFRAAQPEIQFRTV